MRIALLAVLAACHEDPPGEALPLDAPVDTPPDPFVGKFESPGDFPHDNCTPGSLAGFARDAIYFDIGLRTHGSAGPLETFVATYLAEAPAPHVLTADDLLVRLAYFNGYQWTLSAVDVCGVDADGTLRGAVARCSDLAGFPCDHAFPFTAAPFARIPGEADGDHLALVGELGADWPGTSTNVRVDGDLAFVSRLDDGLRVVSIANPAAPVEVGHLALADDWANDLKIVHALGRRYVVTASPTTNIIDATDAGSPVLVAQLPFSAHSVFVDGTTAYVVTGANSALEIWDLATPNHPKKLGAFEQPDRPVAWHDVYVAGGIAYLSDINGSGLHVIDVRDPAHAVELGGELDPGFATMWHSPWLTTVAGRPIAIDGTEFSTPGMRLLDGDPQSPTFLATLGEWSLARGSAHNLMAIGSLVYVAHYQDGVRVIDIANPAQPVQRGYFNTWIVGHGTVGDLGTFGIDLDPVRKRIYVADSVRGLVILQGDTTVFP